MDLLEGENVLWRGQPSWRAMLSFYVRWGIIALLPAILSLVGQAAGWDLPDTLLIGISVVALAVVILGGWLMRLATRYVVTDKRLHIRRGILSRHNTTTSIDRVQDINTRQTALDRLLKVGDVTVETAGDETTNIIFARIGDPDGLVHLLGRLHQQGPEHAAGL